MGCLWTATTLISVVETSSRAEPFQLYLTSMCKGVEYLLLEYADDITYLDLLVENDGPLPLSQIISHLQKYFYCLPAVYKICTDLTEKNIRGCQILDYLARYRSGYPYVNEVVNVMLRHVRAVFLKQCMGWMLYADLDDVGQEFFVQARQTPAGEAGAGGGAGAGSSLGDPLDGFYKHLTGQGRAAELERKFERIFSGTMKSAAHGAWVSSDVGLEEPGGEGSSEQREGGAATTGTGAGARTGLNEGKIPFDWASTYSLRLDYVPESHMTSRLASKVLLAGKAVRMLQAILGSNGVQHEEQQQEQREGMDFQGINDTYRYLAGVRGTKYQYQTRDRKTRRVAPGGLEDSDDKDGEEKMKTHWSGSTSRAVATALSK